MVWEKLCGPGARCCSDIESYAGSSAVALEFPRDKEHGRCISLKSRCKYQAWQAAGEHAGEQKMAVKQVLAEKGVNYSEIIQNVWGKLNGKEIFS